MNLSDYLRRDIAAEVFYPMGEDTKPAHTLNIINNILASNRYKAENGQKLGGGYDADTHFHTIALVKTEKGKFYISTNMGIGEAVERDCAEKRAIGQALEDDAAMKISEMWLMGAKDINGQMDKEYESKRCCPCGACLQVIDNHRASDEINIHMLPANNGNVEVEYANPNIKANHYSKQHVQTQSIRQLVPYPSLNLRDRKGRMKEVIKTGYDGLSEVGNVEIWSPEEMQQHLQACRDVDDSVDFVKLNAFMKNSILQTYAQQDMDVEFKGEIDSIAVGVVRAADGTLYAHTSSKSEMQSTTISGVFGAITQMTNGRVIGSSQMTDIWEMRINPQKFKRVQDSWDAKSSADIKVIVPRGDALGRIQKFSNNLLSGVRDATGEAIADRKLKHGARIHPVPFNDGSKEAAEYIEKAMYDANLWMKVDKYHPHAFANPRQTDKANSLEK